MNINPCVHLTHNEESLLQSVTLSMSAGKWVVYKPEGNHSNTVQQGQNGLPITQTERLCVVIIIVQFNPATRCCRGFLRGYTPMRVPREVLCYGSILIHSSLSSGIYFCELTALYYAEDSLCAHYRLSLFLDQKRRFVNEWHAS